MEISGITICKNKLLERQAELNHQLKVNNYLDIKSNHVHESLGELSTYDNHPADTGTALFEREKDIALVEHYEKELKDIEQALEAIEKGNYGKCIVCHKNIPLERLQALPTTLYCIDHSPEQHISHSRPVEEEVLSPPFGKFEIDNKDATFFDSEDAWQEVARYGTSETPSDFADPEMLDYNSMLIEEDEFVGFVEDIDAFIGTDIYGQNIQVYPNAIHQKYEESLDEAGAMATVGNLGETQLEEE
jgi:YteA family regulatory protein